MTPHGVMTRDDDNAIAIPSQIGLERSSGVPNGAVERTAEEEKVSGAIFTMPAEGS